MLVDLLAACKRDHVVECFTQNLLKEHLVVKVPHLLQCEAVTSVWALLDL